MTVMTPAACAESESKEKRLDALSQTLNVLRLARGAELLHIAVTQG